MTGARMGVIQAVFRDFFNLGADFPVDASQFDLLLDEDDTLECGELVVEAVYTTGHTPAHMSWKIGDTVFVGDTLFVPDFGSAGQRYDSIQRLHALPEATRLFMCRDPHSAVIAGEHSGR